MPSTRSSSFSRRHVLTAGAAALAAPSLSWAQASYPTHPITLTHGFGAGGNADVVARLMAQKLSESLKQPVVVDIKTGANSYVVLPGSVHPDTGHKYTADDRPMVFVTDSMLKQIRWAT